MNKFVLRFSALVAPTTSFVFSQSVTLLGSFNPYPGQKYSDVWGYAAGGRYEYRLKQIDFDGNYEYSNIVEVEINSVNSFILEQNYPNPFNPSTTIKYSLPENGLVNLSVYNLLSEKVSEVVNKELFAGEYQTNFDASNLPSGVYIAELKYGTEIKTIKMSLTK